MKLKEQFTKKNKNFVQLKRTDKVALYEVTQGTKKFYEIIKIIFANNDYKQHGFNVTKGDEKYPCDEQFGTYAKTTCNLERAEEIYKDFIVKWF
jgi:hypothetical protein